MQRSNRRPLLRTAVLFATVLAALLIIGDWPALESEVRYSVLPAQSAVLAASAPANPAAPVDLTAEAAFIDIPALGIHAPIVWNIDGDRTEEYLDQGVVHLKGSGKPGQPGNLFLTGHSSDYLWKHDPYATVFTLLPHLKPGNTVVISGAGASYAYKVDSSEVVSPDDLAVTAPSKTATLTLLTCYPIGTSAKRLVVHASLVAE